MKKKFVAAFLACVLCGLSVPVNAWAGADGDSGYMEDDEDFFEEETGGNEPVDPWDIEIDPDPEPESLMLTIDDLRVTPSSKIIEKGGTFKIKVIAASNSDLADLSDEEWYEACQECIDGIEYRSTKSKIASVNKNNGKVTGRKRGSAYIKTTIYLSNGDSRTYKTKVYVKK